MLGFRPSLKLVYLLTKEIIMEEFEEDETRCPLCDGPLASDGVCADDNCDVD
jgi:hypothetical protein